MPCTILKVFRSNNMIIVKIYKKKEGFKKKGKRKKISGREAYIVTSKTLLYDAEYCRRFLLSVRFHKN